MPFVTESNRIFYEQNGTVLGEITFPEFGENIVNIDHTYVDEMLRGQGVAGTLMQYAADEIRRTGRKAIPTCSYAKKWFSQHEDYADILK